MEFFQKNWPRIGMVMAPYVLFMLIMFKDAIGLPLFLIWLQFPIYLVHQTEEYLIPGGFREFVNSRVFRMDIDGRPLNERNTFWINILFVWIAYPLLAAFSHWNLNVGVYLFYFTLLNGLSHVAAAIRLRRYNPGLVASLFLNIGVSAYSIAVLSGTGKIWWATHVIAIAVGIVFHILLMGWIARQAAKYRK